MSLRRGRGGVTEQPMPALQSPAEQSLPRPQRAIDASQSRRDGNSSRVFTGRRPEPALRSLAEPVIHQATGRKATPPPSEHCPTDLEAVARALAEVAALSRAGLTGRVLWEPVLGSAVDEPGTGLAAWAEQVAHTEVGAYAKATCGIEHLASAVGASLGDLLDGLASTIQGHLDTTEALEGAIAGPKASARLLQYLPLAGLALGMVMGTNVVAVLLDGAVGTMALVLGLGLMALGRAWSGGLLRRAKGHVDVAGLVAVDILAATLRAGLPIPAALQATAQAWSGPTGEALARAGRSLAAGQSWEQAWPPAPPGSVIAGIERALGLGWRNGVRCSPLLATVKTTVLRAERLRGQKAAARLGVSLMAPLGLCYLPAFMALGLAPLVISLASGLSLNL